jgi:hypothetical protein
MDAKHSTSDRVMSNCAGIGAVTPDVLRAALFYLADSLSGSNERQWQRSAGDRLPDYGRLGTTEAECDLVACISQKLGGDREIPLWASVRVTALWRLLASRPELLRAAAYPPRDSGMLREDTIALAAELELVAPRGSAGPPEFDGDLFAAALGTSEAVERLGG